MVQESHGLHHFHKRKRIHKKLEQYPNPDKFKRFMDNAIYGIGIFGPIMTIPQVWTIWIHQNAAGVSTISWIGYLISAMFWFTYGVLHREKPIIFTNIVWVILEIFIIIGTILY